MSTMRSRWIFAVLLLLNIAAAPTEQRLGVGDATKLAAGSVDGELTSSAREVAAVYKNGWVVALKPGDATINSNGKAIARIRVFTGDEQIVPLSKIKQYPDNRKFTTADGRKCVGSELNGKMVGEKLANRVTNPKPLDPKKPLEWELVDPTPIVDGAGVPMGTVAPQTLGDRKVPATKFNYGMSKVIGGKLWLYAFAVRMKADPKLTSAIDPAEIKSGVMSTSAWVPLDCVVDKETLLDLIGIGDGKLPKLPLENQRYRITGGDPKQYILPSGDELSIVPHVEKDGPAPSDYLRRPSGTVNVIYSIPGFDLGGQGMDSFLITGGAIFRPARGAKVFLMPTFYPINLPRKGEKTNKTMTFLYGAVEVPGSETVYGWIAKEALEMRR